MADFKYACSQANFAAFFHLSDFSLSGWTFSLHWVHVEMTLFFLPSCGPSVLRQKNITLKSFCFYCAAFVTIRQDTQ